jgi:16S rRNA (adenine1518-N6/adenine1519-N6)-dimethyltransferase
MRISPKKSLGQNFLADQNIRNKIIGALDLQPADIVLEIGSGKGELTELISRRVRKIYALEIDRRLYPALSGFFAGRENVQIINQDILKFDLSEFIKHNKIRGKLKVFGNIPYYISSPIIEHLLKFRAYLNVIYITTQKEFAARVAASPGTKDYGSFSCFVQYYALPEILFQISRNCFKPSPKVDSSFLELKIRESPAVCVKDEGLFFRIIRSAFNQRRKTLRNSLSDLISEEALNKFFKASGIDNKVRPERLSLNDFALLANYITHLS